MRASAFFGKTKELAKARTRAKRRDRSAAAGRLGRSCPPPSPRLFSASVPLSRPRLSIPPHKLPKTHSGSLCALPCGFAVNGVARTRGTALAQQQRGGGFIVFTTPRTDLTSFDRSALRFAKYRSPHCCLAPYLLQSETLCFR